MTLSASIDLPVASSRHHHAPAYPPDHRHHRHTTDHRAANAGRHLLAPAGPAGLA